MTSNRANAVNRAIWEQLGGKVFKERDTWIIQDIDGSRRVMGEQGNLEWWMVTASNLLAKHYYSNLNAAIAAAGELLPGRWQLIHFNSGFRFDWSDNTDKWYDIHPKSNAPADIAAAICEAIVQACGLVVESEVSDA